MNYADLFRMTLRRRCLELAALIVLVRGPWFFLRKAALQCAWLRRRCWACVDAVALFLRCCCKCPGVLTAPGGDLLLTADGKFGGSADRDTGADGADAAAADRHGTSRGTWASMWPWC